MHLHGKIILLILLLTVLVGCTSNWRAPLESRDSYSSKTYPKPTNQRRTNPPKVYASSYRVRKGDTLYAIAWRSNTDFRDLSRWNNIGKPYTIFVGQRLRLRAPKLQKTSPSKIPKTKKKISPKQAITRTETKKINPKMMPLRKLRWRWPSHGKTLETFKRGNTLRKGIKIAGKPGDKVVAAESGRVVYSGSGLIGYGRLIIIKHNEKYLSAYAHNRRLLVKEGQQVTKGKQIAELGKANDGQPLLHFEIRRDGKPINPMALLPRR